MSWSFWRALGAGDAANGRRAKSPAVIPGNPIPPPSRTILQEILSPPAASPQVEPTDADPVSHTKEAPIP
jgi:hypothetical protein